MTAAEPPDATEETQSTAPVRAVQRAAIDRAVAADGRAEAVRGLAFAGALEAACGPDGPDDLLGSALVSTAAARAIDVYERRPRVTATPWTPRAARDHPPWLLDGAVLACRLTDLDAEGVARLADLPVATVESALAERE